MCAIESNSLHFRGPLEIGIGQRSEGQRSRHNKGTIPVTVRASKRQKEPSIALSFYKLRLSYACHGRGQYSTVCIVGNSDIAV